MKIVAYTYDADTHCVACTQARFALHADRHKDYDTDPHGVYVMAVDREGNEIYPVFSTDEIDLSSCGTCRAPI